MNKREAKKIAHEIAVVVLRGALEGGYCSTITDNESDCLRVESALDEMIDSHSRKSETS